MKSGGLLRDVLVTCMIGAIASIAAGALTGHVATGFGLAAGLTLGSLNGYLIQGLMDRGTPFAASGILRIVLFSSLALLAVFALRPIAWTVPLGIGLAQLVMVVAGVRRGLRAR